ncbi:MAG TPA: hypothetical protein VIJ54_09295 [Actinomycetes bacterium]
MPNQPSTTRHTRTRRWLPALAGGAALSLAVVLAAPASAAPAATSTAPARTTVAEWGGGYLARQIAANGGHLDSFGVADVVDTAYAVVGLHAAGVGRAASAQAIAYLKTQLGTAFVTNDGTDNPGNLAYFVLAAVSAGQDPRAFGGTTAKDNLVARLLATARTTGPDAGLFGTSDPSFDGAFREGTVLTALKAARIAPSNAKVVAAEAWLTRQQCADGLWTSYRADTSVACPAADPNTFAGPDTNSTGMAAQGLAAYAQYPKKFLLLKALRSIQSSDAGFPFLAIPGQPSDPDSTALSVQAILAEQGSPGAAVWTKGSATPYTALASYQLSCSDPVADRGAFFFPGDRSPSTLATVQAIPAMAGKTFPLPASLPSTATPRILCGTAAATSGARSATLVRPTLAGTAGHCPGKTGVTVAVDMTAFGKGVKVRCAPGAPATGIAALQQAGFTPKGTVQSGLGFVCRINGLPTVAQQACITTPPVTAYWSYYHALAGATTWSYSTLGPLSYKPPQGSIEAWAFGASAKPSKTPAQVRLS